MLEILSKNDQKKIEGLGLTEEAISIIKNCECGIINYGYIHDLSKMRKWEIMEVIGNYLDNEGKYVPDWTDIKRIATFCKAFAIKEEELAQWYALGINEEGFSIAYALNEDIVLILEDKNDYPQLIMPEEESEGGLKMNEIRFRYILKSNYDVEIAGTVYIPEDVDARDDEFDIEYERAGNAPSWNLFINHYGVELKRTDKQDMEIEELKEIYCTDSEFLTIICEFAEEETNGIVDLGKAYLIIDDYDFDEYLREMN